MVVHIKSNEEFEEIKKDAGDQLLVVDFFATWCGPCKMIAPKIEKLSSEYPNVLFAKIDVDELEDLAQECGISAMPTFQYYKQGQKVYEVMGANLESIVSAIKEYA